MVNGFPLSFHPLESCRSPTEERIHMTCLNIWLVLISWSAWDPVSHFPSDPKEQDVTHGDATSPTAICCSRAPPEKPSNQRWPWELCYMTASDLDATDANLRSSSLEPVAHYNLSDTMSTELLCWSICRLRPSNQTESLELMCLFFHSVRWQAILRICH